MEFVGISVLIVTVVAGLSIAARFVVVPKLTSPTPQTFDIEISDAYKRILKLLTNQSVGAHHWKITDSIENQYIIADLMYNEPLQLLQVNGVVNFDFKKLTEQQTTVRWFCRWDELSDIVMAEKVERLTDSWLRTALTDAQHSVELITLNSEFETKLSRDSAYDRLFKRLAAPSDGTTVWTVNDFAAPSNISTKVETIALHKRAVTCAAKLDFDLSMDGKLT
ncbi:MAG: hypothetical protein HYX67_10185, partial [Candidatus Melainabacteria bacterium]|nr:hypothetical protein [Candidatus Melainabacteria bacterium]